MLCLLYGGPDFRPNANEHPLIKRASIRTQKHNDHHSFLCPSLSLHPLLQSPAPSRAPLAWAKPPPPVVSPSVAEPQPPPPRNAHKPDATTTSTRPLPSPAAAVHPTSTTAAASAAATSVAPSPDDESSSSTSTPSPPPVVTYRDKQWLGLMGDGTSNPLNDEGVTDLESLRRLAWNGIPGRWRPEVWQLLLAYLPSDKKRRAAALTRKRREYAEVEKGGSHRMCREILDRVAVHGSTLSLCFDLLTFP